MGEEPSGPYSPRQIGWALALSALLGWAGVTVAALDVTNLNSFLGLLGPAAVIGLPIAFVLTFSVGAPILDRLARQQIGWLRAATGGSSIAAIIAAISVIIGRLRGLSESLDPGSFSQIGGGDFIIEVDGLLTPYGWYLLGIRTIVFIGFGAFVGLVVRLVIGPGRLSD